MVSVECGLQSTGPLRFSISNIQRSTNSPEHYSLRKERPSLVLSSFGNGLLYPAAREGPSSPTDTHITKDFAPLGSSYEMSPRLSSEVTRKLHRHTKCTQGSLLIADSTCWWARLLPCWLPGGRHVLLSLMPLSSVLCIAPLTRWPCGSVGYLC